MALEENLPEWVNAKGEGTYELRLFVKPNAKEDMIIGVHDGRLKIKIKAQAIEGKANDHLVQFLSKGFAIASRNITIKKGQQSKYKLVIIAGLFTIDWIAFKANLMDNH